MSAPDRSPVLIAGPTASGKSAVALVLAEDLGAEIISADSMQVYRGMDIGTAKPGSTERALIPHHLLDVVEPTERFDAARWLLLARRCEKEILGRGRRVVVSGGTGFYFRAWLRGLDEVSPVPPAMRAELEAMPTSDLLAELAERDRLVHDRIDRANRRRVVRALEILRLGGGRPAPQESATNHDPDPLPKVVVLRREPGDLRRRIETRVDAMFAAGLVDEVRALMVRGLTVGCTAGQAIGYRQVLEHLAGVRDVGATRELVKTRTWQYARRQMTWFRHQLPVTWCDVPESEPAERTAERVWEAHGRGMEGEG